MYAGIRLPGAGGSAQLRAVHPPSLHGNRDNDSRFFYCFTRFTFLRLHCSNNTLGPPFSASYREGGDDLDFPIAIPIPISIAFPLAIAFPNPMRRRTALVFALFSRRRLT